MNKKNMNIKSLINKLKKFEKEIDNIDGSTIKIPYPKEIWNQFTEFEKKELIEELTKEMLNQKIKKVFR